MARIKIYKYLMGVYESAMERAHGNKRAIIEYWIPPDSDSEYGVCFNFGLSDGPGEIINVIETNKPRCFLGTEIDWSKLETVEMRLMDVNIIRRYAEIRKDLFEHSEIGALYKKTMNDQHGLMLRSMDRKIAVQPKIEGENNG